MKDALHHCHIALGAFDEYKCVNICAMTDKLIRTHFNLKHFILSMFRWKYKRKRKYSSLLIFHGDFLIEDFQLKMDEIISMQISNSGYAYSGVVHSKCLLLSFRSR